MSWAGVSCLVVKESLRSVASARWGSTRESRARSLVTRSVDEVHVCVARSGQSVLLAFTHATDSHPPGSDVPRLSHGSLCFPAATRSRQPAFGHTKPSLYIPPWLVSWPTRGLMDGRLGEDVGHGASSPSDLFTAEMANRTEMRSLRGSRAMALDDLASFRGSSRIRPSMHSEFMVRKDSNPGSGRQGRVRSLSNESDPGKPRSSVPLLYASTVSSMSTLSSSFYQYDSTGADAIDADALLPTPSSNASGDTMSRSGQRSKKPQEAQLRLPPVQERAIRKDAARMTRELIMEQVQALDLLHNRNGSLRRHVAVGNEVATAKGVRVFEKPGIGGGGASGRIKKNAVKRYTAHWQVNGTVEEVMELLLRDENVPDRYLDSQNAMHPETVNCKLLWRSPPRSMYNHDEVSGDEGDVGGVVMVEMEPEEEDFRLHSDRNGPTNPYHHTQGARSVASTAKSSRRRLRRTKRPTEWMGINWWVQHMPNKLSRDRDLIVLERQSEFETVGGGRSRRGFVHLSHSVDLADVSSVEKRLVSPFVRALVIQSGLVVVESDEPGVLDVSNTLEMDFAGHLSAGQHRQLVLKRLMNIEPLSELLWKTRLLKAEHLLWKPKLDKSSDSHRSKCERCQFRASRFSRRVLEPCRVCERVVCNTCCNTWEFSPALVAWASRPNKGLETAVDRDGGIKARVCAHCVQEHSRARLRNQSSVDLMQSDSYDFDEDEEAERGDVAGKVLPRYTVTSQHLPRKLARPSSAPIMRESEWNPSRSSRIAEDLVDDFLMSMPSDSVLPEAFQPSSPSSFSDDGEPDETSEDTSEPEFLPPPLNRRSISAPATAEAWKPRRDSRANMLFAQFQTQEQPPRRKLSIFEALPEPEPRKNVVLYEVPT